MATATSMQAALRGEQEGCSVLSLPLAACILSLVPCGAADAAFLSGEAYSSLRQVHSPLPPLTFTCTRRLTAPAARQVAELRGLTSTLLVLVLGVGWLSRLKRD